ncbi:6893_t:CDS:2, partial [Cetraspora pellucida]
MPKYAKKQAKSQAVFAGIIAGTSQRQTQAPDVPATAKISGDILTVILEKLNELSEKINKIDRCLSDMDERFSDNYSIYSEESDYKEVTAKYLSAEHEEFFSSMSDTKCDTYFKKNIASP